MGMIDKARRMADGAIGVAMAGGAHLRSMLGSPPTQARADDAARELGYLLYRSRTQDLPLGDEADRLIEQIAELEASAAAGAPAPEDSKAPSTAKDPVCGMTVKTANAKWTHELDGTTYYFCSQGCMERFTQHPAAYTS